MRGQMTHLDPGVLAEFDAGLITGRRGARISAHLAGCDRCRALAEELAGMSALFATVPAPAMPDRVAQRLEGALAAEVAHRNSAERAEPDLHAAPEARRRRAGNPRFRLVTLRVLAPAAVVLLAAGGYGLSQLGGRVGQATTSSGAAATGAARPVSPAAMAPESSGASARSELMAPSDFTVVIATTDFVPGTFRQQIQAALLAAPTARTTQTPSKDVRRCVLEVTSGASPRLVEKALFKGQPATIVVVSTSRGDVTSVAGPLCSATQRDLLTPAVVLSGISGP